MAARGASVEFPHARPALKQLNQNDKNFEYVREVFLIDFSVHRLLSRDLFASKRKGVLRISVDDKTARQIQFSGRIEDWRVPGEQLLYYGDPHTLKFDLKLVELDEDDRVALERLAVGLAEIKKIAEAAPPPYNASSIGFDVASAAARYAKYWVDDDTELCVVTSLFAPTYAPTIAETHAQQDYTITRGADIRIQIRVVDTLKPVPTKLHRISVFMNQIHGIDAQIQHEVDHSHGKIWKTWRRLTLRSRRCRNTLEMAAAVGSAPNLEKQLPYAALPPVQTFLQCEPGKYGRTAIIQRQCLFHGDWPEGLNFFVAFKFFFTDKKPLFKDGLFTAFDQKEQEAAREAFINSLATIAFTKPLDAPVDAAKQPAQWNAREIARVSVSSLFNIVKQYKPSDEVFFDWDGQLSWQPQGAQTLFLNMNDGKISDDPPDADPFIEFEIIAEDLPSVPVLPAPPAPAPLADALPVHPLVEIAEDDDDD